MLTNKNSYNKIANKWNDIRHELPLNECIINFVDKLQPNCSILDIGCGTGYPIDKYLSEQGYLVTGIDISENMIAIAKKQNYENCNFEITDFFEFKPNKKFDAVIAFDSFFHFPKDKQKKIYQKVANWLNVEGYLFFTHGKNNGEIVGEMFGETFYYSSLDITETKDVLIENGFKIELLIEDYKEKNNDRELLIIAKKIK